MKKKKKPTKRLINKRKKEIPNFNEVSYLRGWDIIVKRESDDNDDTGQKSKR